MKTSIQVKICFLLQLQDFFSSSLLPPPSPSSPPLPFIVFIGIPHSIEFLPEFLLLKFSSTRVDFYVNLKMCGRSESGVPGRVPGAGTPARREFSAKSGGGVDVEGVSGL